MTARVARCTLCGATSRPSDRDDELELWRRGHLAYQHTAERVVYGDTEITDYVSQFVDGE